MSPEKQLQSGQQSHNRPDFRRPPPQRPQQQHQQHQQQQQQSYSRGRGSSRGRGGFESRGGYERGGMIIETKILKNYKLSMSVL